MQTLDDIRIYPWQECGTYTDIKYHKWNGIAKITINRPEVRNAFRPLTVSEMMNAMENARNDQEIGVIILTGEGNAAFCSGGDQRIRGDAGYADGEGVHRLNVLDFQKQIRGCPKPIIAMVAGYAIGGGHVLHVVCDLTIAADNAIFGQTGPKVGSFDGGFGSSYLSRIVGQKKAREIWYLCRKYSAKEALEMGLINCVVPLDKLEETTVEWCLEILQHSPLALRCLKSAFNADCDGQSGIQELAGNATLLYYMSEEAQEGHKAYLEKRRPDFSRFPSGRNMNRVQVWSLAARPKTLVAGISPALIGTTLAIGEGRFDLVIFLFTLLTGLCIQIGTNLSNDYFDFIKGADTSERKGFLRVTQAGLVTVSSMKRAIAATFAIAFLCGCYLIYQGGAVIGAMLAVYILLSILYTAGPFPLAYLGLGDLFVLVLYGPGAVLITYYLQTGVLAKKAFLAGLSPGALSMAILVVNNVRDIEEDRAANKKTLPVRFGRVFGKSQFVFAILLALVPILFFYPTHPFSLLALLILLPALPLVRRMVKNQEPRELNQLFGKTGKLLWLFTLLFCIGWML